MNQTPQSAKRHRWRRNDDDVRKWTELFQTGTTILRIAKQYKVDPDTISRELHSLGLTITPGHHMVEQLPLRYSVEFIELVDRGPNAVLEFVKTRVWGIQVTQIGEKQLRNFCEFVRLHHHGIGVEEISRRLSSHRSTIAHWRDGTDQPYLIRASNDTLSRILREGWKLLPMHLASGGGEPSGWILVPEAIRSYNDVLEVINQVQPLEETYRRAGFFGLTKTQVQGMRPEFFAYQLGIMVGDSGKLGGEQPRYASMNLDLQLTKGQPTNERLGEFVLMCANNLGLEMTRIKDKPPSGRQLLGKNPTPAYRWSTERSPLIAWMFSVGLDLGSAGERQQQPTRFEWNGSITPPNPFESDSFRERLIPTEPRENTRWTLRAYLMLHSSPNCYRIWD